MCWLLNFRHAFLNRKENATSVLLAIGGTSEYTMNRTCLPSGFRSRARYFPRVGIFRWYNTDVASGTRALAGLILCFTCSCRRSVRYIGHARCQCSHVPASRLCAARSTRRTASYDTRVPTCDVTQRFSLSDTLEHGSPLRGRDLPARIRYSLKAVRERHQYWIVKGRCERIITR